MFMFFFYFEMNEKNELPLHGLTKYFWLVLHKNFIHILLFQRVLIGDAKKRIEPPKQKN